MAAKIRLVLVEKAWELKLYHPSVYFQSCILRSSISVSNSPFALTVPTAIGLLIDIVTT